MDGYQRLRGRVRGALLRPGEEGYDEARRVWNGAVDRRPALIARCAGADVVALAVRFALSLLKAVRVDPRGQDGPGRLTSAAATSASSPRSSTGSTRWAAYGHRLKRLTALKDRQDPTNLFRLDANIPPSRGRR